MLLSALALLLLLIVMRNAARATSPKGPASSRVNAHEAVQAGERQALTPEFVRKHTCEGNVVAVTWANSAIADMLDSWMKRMRLRAGVKCFIVGALDMELYDALSARSEPVFALFSSEHHALRATIRWGSASFKAMGATKVWLIRTLAEFGVNTLISDADCAFMRDPFPFLNQFSGADLLISSDAMHHTDGSTSGYQLERYPRTFADLNLGQMFVRPSAAPFLRSWERSLASSTGKRMWDQKVLNQLIKRGLDRRSEDSNRLLTSKHRNVTLTFGVLPCILFQNGHVAFVQRLHEKYNVSAISAHTTHQFSGTIGKRHRMREAMLFEDSEDWYTPANGLMSFDNPLPQRLLNAEQTLDTHFELVHLQLKRYRSALGVAIALNRTLILSAPSICGHDRWWAPHNGRIPGSELKLPFRCPADHVLNLPFLHRSFDEGSRYGPSIALREHSLLQNPRAPGHVKRSIARLDAKDAKDSYNLSALIEPHSTDKQLLRQLSQDILSAQVLHFRSIDRIFAGFESLTTQRQWINRVRDSTSIYCCVRSKKPGHIRYDALKGMFNRR
jgi:hypothetical protein